MSLQQNWAAAPGMKTAAELWLPLAMLTARLASCAQQAEARTIVTRNDPINQPWVERGHNRAKCLRKFNIPHFLNPTAVAEERAGRALGRDGCSSGK